MSSLYNPKEMKARVDFPVGIISYRTASDGGKGDKHMWAIVEFLDSQGISTYCGLMVRTENWQKEWYGKMYQVRLLLVELGFIMMRLPSHSLALPLHSLLIFMS